LLSICFLISVSKLTSLSGVSVFSDKQVEKTISEEKKGIKQALILFDEV
jgi:hypothetical protein